MQQITFIGHVGKDAVVREVGTSKAIGFRVAVNDTYRDKNDKTVETTSWYDCTMWVPEGRSTKLADYLKTGQQVYVQGTPKAAGYQDKDKNWVATIEVRVEPRKSAIKLLGRKADEVGTASTAGAAGTTGAADDDNDLPF
jgi:single-strand DNA-binding protein